MTAFIQNHPGIAQSAPSNALGWFGRLFNRQAMRSVHFISFAWFVGFILAHGAMVFVTGIRQNTNHTFGGLNDASWTGFPIVPPRDGRHDYGLACRLTPHHPSRASRAAHGRIHDRLAHGVG